MSRNLYRTSKQRDYNYAFKQGLRFGIFSILFGIAVYIYLLYEEQEPNMDLHWLLYSTYAIGGKLLSAGIWVLLGLVAIILGRVESNKIKRSQ